MNKLERPVEINGNGSSIWANKPNFGTSGSSKGVFLASGYNIHNIDYEEGNGIEPYELQVFGVNTEWYHYTDDLIEKEVNEKLLPKINLQNGEFEIKEVCWSEMGMQPSGGWSFDIIKFEKKKQ